MIFYVFSCQCHRLGADLKLRDPISSSVSSMLTTTSTKTSSIAMWNPFTGSHRASVIGYQVGKLSISLCVSYALTTCLLKVLMFLKWLYINFF